MDPSATLLKEQGSYNLVQNIGHKGPVLSPRCIEPGSSRTQILFYSILSSCGYFLQVFQIISLLPPSDSAVAVNNNNNKNNNN
jgi:hypothetical protein